MTVGVRELRQNLSKYLVRVKDGEALTVTERGRVVARLVPARASDDLHASLVEKFGATPPTSSEHIADIARRLQVPRHPAGTTDAYLDESRRERF
jgi:prevent-host-death family protein